MRQQLNTSFYTYKCDQTNVWWMRDVRACDFNLSIHHLCFFPTILKIYAPKKIKINNSFWVCSPNVVLYNCVLIANKEDTYSPTLQHFYIPINDYCCMLCFGYNKLLQPVFRLTYYSNVFANEIEAIPSINELPKFMINFLNDNYNTQITC